MKPGKAVFIVLDSVGVGALPDARAYGDEGTNTVGNTARAIGGLNIPNLHRFGLGKIVDAPGFSRLMLLRGALEKWLSGQPAKTVRPDTGS